MKNESFVIRNFCAENSIRLPDDWRTHLNCVKLGTDKEEHFLMKARIVYALLRNGQTCFTEFPLFALGSGWSPSKRTPVADVVWLDEMKVIELESEFSEKKAKEKVKDFLPFDVFVFDLKQNSIDDVLYKIGLEKSK